MEADTARLPQSQQGKQAACLNCRRSKIRCNRRPGEARCEKCRHANVDCIVPSHHLGRQKGVKNKRKGLEKAIHQIEQAIKRPRVDSEDGPGTDDAQRAISGLQELLDKVQGHLVQNTTNEFADSPHHLRNQPSSRRDGQADESLALDDAENPLQLLARASDLQLSPSETRPVPTKSPLPSVALPTLPPETTGVLAESSARSFFVQARASLDTGPELDPVDLGLVTFDEAESLFSL
ncbi:uncharacterized protein PFLUO_LOCUS874 [Penicillium psychrofluorescens]|uniref:uncharacterized protein n=1 Tax=Penicillium psychrofluorescens TaxID=3158075 RepID=UPI003CCCD462